MRIVIKYIMRSVSSSSALSEITIGSTSSKQVVNATFANRNSIVATGIAGVIEMHKHGVIRRGVAPRISSSRCVSASSRQSRNCRVNWRAMHSRITKSIVIPLAAAAIIALSYGVTAPAKHKISLCKAGRRLKWRKLAKPKPPRNISSRERACMRAGALSGVVAVSGNVGSGAIV